MESNVPATADEPATPALIAADAASPALPSRPRQNVTTGLFPLALAVLVLIFLALALWALMSTAGGGP